MRNRNGEGVVKGPTLANPSTFLQEPNMEKELAEIRKEVVESRNLVIKTDNLLKNLHAELKLVSKRQDEIAKRGWIGSFVAYGLIAALAGAGAISTINARSSAARDEAAALTKQVDDLKASVARLEKEAGERRVAAEVAARAYAAIADGRDSEARLRGVDALATLDRAKLTPLESRALDDRARFLKSELASTALEDGRNAFRRQDYKTASVQLSRFLTLAPDSPDAVQAALFLGNSFHAQHAYAEAIAPLEKFVANGKGMKNLDYGIFMLAQSYEQTGNHAKAVELAMRGITEHPASEFIAGMRHVLSQAKAAQAGPGAPGAPGAAPSPAPGAAPAPLAPSGPANR